MQCDFWEALQTMKVSESYIFQLSLMSNFLTGTEFHFY